MNTEAHVRAKSLFALVHDTGITVLQLVQLDVGMSSTESHHTYFVLSLKMYSAVELAKVFVCSFVKCETGQPTVLWCVRVKKY